MINWTVRIKNKAFWLAFIPAALLLVRQICALCGVVIEIDGLSAQLVAIVETVFILLSLLGIVTDPTTEGMRDSVQALTYTEPKKYD